MSMGLKMLAADFGLQQMNQIVYYGVFSGFPVVVQTDPNNHKWFVRVHAAADQPDGMLSSLLNQMILDQRVLKAAVDGYAICIDIQARGNGKKAAETLRTVSDQLVRHLKFAGYHPACAQTGQNDPTLRLCNINNRWLFLSQEGYRQTVNALEDAKASKRARREIMPLGILGALLGALAGGALWVVIGHLNYYAWIAGFITVSGAFYGYKLLGGRVGKVGAVLVFIISIAVLFGASLTEWAWRFTDWFREAGVDAPFFEVLRATPELILSDSDVQAAVVKDLLIGLGLVLVAGIPATIGLYKESAGHYVVQRFEERAARGPVQAI